MTKQPNHPEPNPAGHTPDEEALPISPAAQDRLRADLRALYARPIPQTPELDAQIAAMAEEHLLGEQPAPPIVLRPAVLRWKWLGGAMSMAAGLMLVAYIFNGLPRSTPTQVPSSNTFESGASATRADSSPFKDKAEGRALASTHWARTSSALAAEIAAAPKTDIVHAQRLAMLMSLGPVTDNALDFTADGKVTFADVDALALRSVGMSASNGLPLTSVDSPEFWAFDLHDDEQAVRR